MGTSTSVISEVLGRRARGTPDRLGDGLVARRPGDVVVAEFERGLDGLRCRSVRRAPAVDGPDVRTVGELARAYLEARGLRRPVVRLPLPGAVARGFREGHATCPDRAVGSTTWEEWLDEQYDSGRSTAAGSAGSPT